MSNHNSNSELKSEVKKEPVTRQQIALKSLELEMRRQRIRQRRQALREDALQYCRRPSTLGIAAVSGFVLARLLPPLLRPRGHSPSRPPSRLLDPFVQMIPVLVFERVRHALIRRARSDYRQNTEETRRQPSPQ